MQVGLDAWRAGLELDIAHEHTIAKMAENLAIAFRDGKVLTLSLAQNTLLTRTEAVMAGVLLEVDNLQAGYGNKTVLQGVSLRVREGEIVALLGRNGAGK